MGWIKNSLIGFVILSVITIGMYSFLGDLNSNYNTGIVYTNQSGDAAQIENMSNSIKEKLNVESISSGGSDSLWTNWKILANVFSVILDVPGLFIASISSSMSIIGVGGNSWISGILITIVGVISALAFMKYVLGKEV